ncbi:hypothetical protein K435DRAFT_605552, partial [Dendrothele bispora CBS 962.96]
RSENAFFLFRRKWFEDYRLKRDLASKSASASPSAPIKKRRKVNRLSKTIARQWKSLSTEERQYWERLAKEKKK